MKKVKKHIHISCYYFGFWKPPSCRLLFIALLDPYPSLYVQWRSLCSGPPVAFPLSNRTPSCLSIVDSDDPEYLYAYIYVDGEHHWVLASQVETIFTSLATWEEIFEWEDC